MRSHVVQALRARRHDRRGTYRYLFVFDDRQSSVHFLFLCFQGGSRGCEGRCRQKIAACGIDSFCPLRLFRCWLVRFFSTVLQVKRVVLTSIYAVHARHATAVIYPVFLAIDARRLAFAGAETAPVALALVDRDAEQRKAGEETQYRSYRTNSIAVSSSVPPCQHEQHNECRDSDQKRRQALYPHLRFIKGIAVRPLGEIGKQVVFPSVQGSEKIGSDTPVGAVTERAKPRTSRCRRSGLR